MQQHEFRNILDFGTVVLAQCTQCGRTTWFLKSVPTPFSGCYQIINEEKSLALNSNPLVRLN